MKRALAALFLVLCLAGSALAASTTKSYVVSVDNTSPAKILINGISKDTVSFNFGQTFVGISADHKLNIVFLGTASVGDKVISVDVSGDYPPVKKDYPIISKDSTPNINKQSVSSDNSFSLDIYFRPARKLGTYSDVFTIVLSEDTTTPALNRASVEVQLLGSAVSPVTMATSSLDLTLYRGASWDEEIPVKGLMVGKTDDVNISMDVSGDLKNHITIDPSSAFPISGELEKKIKVTFKAPTDKSLDSTDYLKLYAKVAGENADLRLNKPVRVRVLDLPSPGYIKPDVTPAPVDLGKVYVGSRVSTLSFDLEVKNPASGGIATFNLDSSNRTNCNVYFKASDNRVNVKPISTAKVEVGVKPSNIGKFSAVVLVKGLPVDNFSSWAQVNVTGNAASLPVSGLPLELDTPKLDFGKVKMGDKKELKLKLTNVNDGTSSWTLRLAGFNFSANLGTFEVKEEYLTLRPGESKEVTVVFKPYEGQPDTTYRARLEVYDASDNNVGVVFLEGQGVQLAPEAKLELDRNSIAFGEVEIGSSKPEKFKVKNTGGADGTFTVAGAGDAFEVSPTSGTVGAGKEVEVTVTFKPKKVEDYSAEITVKDGKGAEVGKVSLSGKGKAKPVTDESGSTGEVVDLGGENVSSDFASKDFTPTEEGYEYKSHGVFTSPVIRASAGTTFTLKVEGGAFKLAGVPFGSVPTPGANQKVEFYIYNAKSKKMENRNLSASDLTSSSFSVEVDRDYDVNGNDGELQIRVGYALFEESAAPSGGGGGGCSTGFAASTLLLALPLIYLLRR